MEGLRELLFARIDSQKDVENERFRSVAQQLTLVERQRVEQKEDTKAAVDAALIAQKEAVKEQTIASEKSIAKSEAATTKQLDQQAVTFRTAIDGVLVILNDLKERVGRLEAMKQGGTEVRDRFSQGWAVVLGGVFALVGIGTLIISLSRL
jgi:hypothetical protein